MIKKFGGAGSIMDSKLGERRRTGRSVDNIVAVSDKVAESPGTSVSQHDNGGFVASVGRCGYGRLVAPA